VETQLRAGHPDVEGLCRALADLVLGTTVTPARLTVGHCCATVGPRSNGRHGVDVSIGRAPEAEKPAAAETGRAKEGRS
jgi:hypothetical protein